MAIVSWRLLARNPAFGVGIGQYYELSGDEMLHLPVGRIYIRQNAHNNFLQILAELGVVGFVCFGALLWMSGRGLWAPAAPPDPTAFPTGARCRGAWRVPDLGGLRASAARAGLRLRVLDDRRSRRRLSHLRFGPCRTAHSRRWPQRSF